MSAESARDRQSYRTLEDLINLWMFPFRNLVSAHNEISGVELWTRHPQGSTAAIKCIIGLMTFANIQFSSEAGKSFHLRIPILLALLAGLGSLAREAMYRA